MEHVCKSYKVAKRNAGMKEACKSLFLRKTEKIQALSDVSFTIHDGEMVGYIGPNGAGKSSTIYSIPKPIYQNNLKELTEMLQLNFVGGAV
jgi:ABC-type uncharacterized transport system ATPase subunit